MAAIIQLNNLSKHYKVPVRKAGLAGTFALTIFFVILSRVIWRKGLKNYSGASA